MKNMKGMKIINSYLSLILFICLCTYLSYQIIFGIMNPAPKPLPPEQTNCDTEKSPLNDPEYDLTLEELFILKETVKSNVKPLRLDLSAYNPTKEQCDNDPHITANGSLSSLPRRCAVSQDLAKRLMNWWVLVIWDGGEMILLVDDTMNIKVKNRIDIRMPVNAVKDAKKFGIKLARQDNVKVYPLWSSKND